MSDATDQPQEFQPLQEDMVVNLSALDGTEPLAGDIAEWVRERKLPAYRVPPVTFNSDGGDLWALRSDIDALAAGERLEPTPREDNDLYEVYVVELEGCPRHQDGCLYVGQSHRSARNRFIQHLVGYHASQGRVTKWGRRLRADLYDLPPCTSRAEIEEMEAATARRLAAEGHAVHPSGLL